MRKHKHKFELGVFSEAAGKHPQMYLFCPCGAVEHVACGVFGDTSDVRIKIIEKPTQTK